MTDKERRNKIVSDIAKQALGLKTLKIRYKDSLDFHNLSVWQIQTSLEMAYDAGLRSAQ